MLNITNLDYYGWLTNLNETGFQDERLKIFLIMIDFYEYYLIERIPALQIQNDKIEKSRIKATFSRQMVLVILTKKRL
jgi:hypothetical protein